MNDSKRTALMQWIARGWTLITLHDVSRGMCSCQDGSTCTSAGKHPRKPAWQSDPSVWIRDEATLINTLNAHPHWNWGVVTGVPSNMWVLDWDVAHDREVEAWLADRGWDRGQGGIPDFGTLTLGPTGGGGWHYVFSLPPDFTPRNSATRNRFGLPPGLDVRGVGGQIVVAPSVSSKGAYGAVLLDRPIGRAPAWLEDMLRPAAPAATDATAGAPAIGNQSYNNSSPVYGAIGPFGPLDSLTAARYRAYADRAVNEVIGEQLHAPTGTRNDTAFRTACRLVELVNAPWAGLDPDLVRGSWWSAGLAHPDGAHVPAAELDGVWQRAVDRIAGAQAAPSRDDISLGLGGTPIPFSPTWPDRKSTRR